MDRALAIWTIYDNPADFPGLFVVRKWLVVDGEARATDVMFTGATLQEVRDQVPPGLHLMPRQPGDEPCIVECWI